MASARSSIDATSAAAALSISLGRVAEKSLAQDSVAKSLPLPLAGLYQGLTFPR